MSEFMASTSIAIFNLLAPVFFMDGWRLNSISLFYKLCILDLLKGFYLKKIVEIINIILGRLHNGKTNWRCCWIWK